MQYLSFYFSHSFWNDANDFLLSSCDCESNSRFLFRIQYIINSIPKFDGLIDIFLSSDFFLIFEVAYNQRVSRLKLGAYVPSTSNSISKCRNTVIAALNFCKQTFKNVLNARTKLRSSLFYILNDNKLFNSIYGKVSKLNVNVHTVLIDHCYSVAST
jgi:hypothetical protein